MMSKFACEAVDRKLCDINDQPDSPFGGITFRMYGDFCQVLPFVQMAASGRCRGINQGVLPMYACSCSALMTKHARHQ